MTLTGQALAQVIGRLNIPIFIVTNGRSDGRQVRCTTSLLTSDHLCVRKAVGSSVHGITFRKAGFCLLPFTSRICIQRGLRSSAVGGVRSTVHTRLTAMGTAVGPGRIGVLVTRNCIVRAKGSADRPSSSRHPLDVNASRCISISLFRSFSCITLNRLRGTRGIGSSGIHCDNSVLGCSGSRAPRRGRADVIAVRGSGLRVRPLQVGPLHSVHAVQDAFSRLVGKRSRSCLFFRLRSARCMLSTVGRLHHHCPRTVKLRCIDQERARSITLRRGQRSLRRLSCPSLFGSFCRRCHTVRVRRSNRGVITSVFSTLKEGS